MKKEEKQQILALTMGDPAGIGPEITVKALSHPALLEENNLLVIGNREIIEGAKYFTQKTTPIRSVSAVDDLQHGYINVFDLPQTINSEYRLGTPNRMSGAASYAYIKEALDLAKQNLIQGVVTNPISKEALHLAGIKYPGHTEIFAEETGTRDYAMVFMLDHVMVSFVTTHCSLVKAIAGITHERVSKMIDLLASTLKSLGTEQPHIAVSGLNPHAGEGGLFGDEETLHIIPAIREAQQKGIMVSGPFPPDTVFMRAFKGEFSGVVSMLHDHGFTALKSREFDRCVNITVGLPIIRTSVGHGTAFDLAGTGKASEKNLIEAIHVARKLCRLKMQKKTGDE